MHMQPQEPIRLDYVDVRAERSISVARRRLIFLSIGAIVLAVECGIVWQDSKGSSWVSLPPALSLLVNSSLAIGAIGLISSAALVLERRIGSLIGAILLTVLVTYLAARIMVATGLVDHRRVHGRMPPPLIAQNDFVLVVAQAWVATILAGIFALSLRRDSMQFILFGSSLAAGLVAAILDASYFIKPMRYVGWTITEWQRLLSSGMLLLNALLIAALIARSLNHVITHRRLRRANPVSST